MPIWTPPIGARKMRWPDREPYEGGFHQAFPSWERFWSSDYGPETVPQGDGESKLRRGGSSDPSSRRRRA